LAERVSEIKRRKPWNRMQSAGRRALPALRTAIGGGVGQGERGTLAGLRGYDDLVVDDRLLEPGEESPRL
jgi:hypothetical protein